MKFLDTLSIQKKNKGVSTGTKWFSHSKDLVESSSPVDGKLIGVVSGCDRNQFEQMVATAQKGFEAWRQWPAPKRGDIIRKIGNELRVHKEPLGKLVSYEMGKSLQEGMGEVQEMIDICDFALGLSRQLYGLTMQSERPGHRMYEQYHPLGIVGIISAFNFPVAVWSWNAMIALVCGDVCIWKPSEKTPLCGIACQQIIAKVFKENKVPEGVCSLMTGGRIQGQWMAEDRRIALISATGSTAMGKAVNMAVGARLGKSLLELGGNNAIIITDQADLDLALLGALFG
ncbi:MAG: aldehyde dehydrogenase family protein, partial [Bacteroidota bacterium]|nr:aldehyde dehydrogenase family protein [Bacteroidota bacterium]